MKKISNEFHQRTITSIFWVIFAGIALNFEKVGPIFSSQMIVAPSISPGLLVRTDA